MADHLSFGGVLTQRRDKKLAPMHASFQSSKWVRYCQLTAQFPARAAKCVPKCPAARRECSEQTGAASASKFHRGYIRPETYHQRGPALELRGGGLWLLRTIQHPQVN